MTKNGESTAVVALSTIAILGLAAASLADTIYVPQDHATIQEAVNASRADDTILVAAGTYAENVIISGSAHQGLQLYGEGDVVIVGQGTAPALTVKSTWDVSVHTLTLHSGGVGLLVSKTKDVSVDGLTVENTAGDGVQIDRSQSVGLCSSVIDGAGGDGIQVTSSYYVNLDETDVTGCTESGIEIAGADGVTIDADNVVSSGGDGVTIDNSDDVSVCGNTITDCGGAAVTCENSSDIVLDENTIDDTAEDAVAVDHTDGIAMYNNDIGSDPGVTIGGDAVHVTSSSDVDMETNYIGGSTGDGVFVTSAGASIQGNEIGDVGGAAVHVAGGASYAYVSSNTISRPGGSGVVVEGTSSTVSDNRVSFAGFDGIEIHGGNNLAGNNAVTRPANDGVCVTNGAGDPAVFLENNTVVRPGDDGVDLGATSRSEITGNTVTRARDNGFELLTGAGNRFDANQAKGSRGFDLFEGTDPSANDVADTNHFKSANKRARHRAHGR